MAFGAMIFSLMILLPIVGVSFEPAALAEKTIGASSVNAFSQSRLWLGLLGSLMVWMCSVGVAMLLRVLTMSIGNVRER
jgi:hypothetical protein